MEGRFVEAFSFVPAPQSVRGNAFKLYTCHREHNNHFLFGSPFIVKRGISLRINPHFHVIIIFIIPPPLHPSRERMDKCDFFIFRTRTWTLIWFNILRHDYIPGDENKWSSALDKNFVLTRRKKLLVFFTSTKSEDGTFPAGITYTRVIKFRTREEWQKITSERKYGIMSFSSFFAFSLSRLSSFLLWVKPFSSQPFLSALFARTFNIQRR